MRAIFVLDYLTERKGLNVLPSTGHERLQTWVLILMSTCLWGTHWLHWSQGHRCPTEWRQTIIRDTADHTILYLFSSSIHLHARAHHVFQLSPAARTITSHQMFVITNLAKDTASRAELMKDVSFPYILYAKYLVLLKITLESHWLCTETNKEASQPVWL